MWIRLPSVLTSTLEAAWERVEWDAHRWVVEVAILIDASCHSSAALGEHGSRAIPPDPAPLPRRLPRAPPAA